MGKRASGSTAKSGNKRSIQDRVREHPELERFLRHLGTITIDLDDEEIEIEATLPDESFAFGSGNYGIARTFDLGEHDALRDAVRNLVKVAQEALFEVDEEYDPNRCDRCTESDCCHIGRIHLTEEERLRILDHLGEPDTPAASAKHFEVDDDLAGYYRHIMRHVDGHCSFLKRNDDGMMRCSIYEVRPQVCREYDAGYCTEATKLKPRRAPLEV